MAMRRNYLYRLITRRVRTAKPRHAEAIRGNERVCWRWNGARSRDEQEAFFRRCISCCANRALVTIDPAYIYTCLVCVYIPNIYTIPYIYHIYIYTHTHTCIVVIGNVRSAIIRMTICVRGARYRGKVDVCYSFCLPLE